MSNNQLHFIKISYFLLVSTIIHFLVLFAIPKNFFNQPTSPLADLSSSLTVKMIPPAAKKPTSPSHLSNELSQKTVETASSTLTRPPKVKSQLTDRKDRSVVKQKPPKLPLTRQTKSKSQHVKKISTANRKSQPLPEPQFKTAKEEKVKITSILPTSEKNLTASKDESSLIKSYSTKNKQESTQLPPIQPESEPEQATPSPPTQTHQNWSAPSLSTDSIDNNRSTNTETSLPAPSTTNNLPVSHTESAITPAQFKANYLHNPQPRYPRLSRRLGEQGHVHLRVQVNPQGRVIVVRIQQSSGFERLDRAAKEAVQNWQFIPAKHGNQAIESWVVVPIYFNLN